MSRFELLAGDHLGTRGGLLGPPICRYERGAGEAPSVLSHLGGISRSGSLLTAHVSEAALRWTTDLLSRRYGGKENVKLAIFRPVGLSREDGEWLGKLWEQWDGTRYGFGLIGLFWLDNLFARFLGKSNVVLARRFIPRRLRKPICSVGIAMKDALHPWFGPRPFLGHTPETTDPDDAWDHWMLHPDRWERRLPPPDYPEPLASFDELLALSRAV